MDNKQIATYLDVAKDQLTRKKNNENNVMIKEIIQTEITEIEKTQSQLRTTK